jgi:YHS domain-containing protein
MKGGILKPGRVTGPRGVEGNIDPMCGRRLNERDPQRASEWDGHLFFFCSMECKLRFDNRNLMGARKPVPAGT